MKFESKLIPSSFTLGGIKIDVVLDEKLTTTHGLLGLFGQAEQSIRIDNTIARKDTVEQTFYHELVHSILGAMSETKLNNDERFVDLFSQFLYQALKTAQYKPLKER